MVAMNLRLDVYHHFPDGAPDPVHALLRQILHELKELKTMSATLADQLTQFQTETAASLDAISTDVTDISADVDSLLAGMTPGTTITQAMVDAQGSIRDRVAALKTALDAVNAKVPPVAPPAP